MDSPASSTTTLAGRPNAASAKEESLPGAIAIPDTTQTSPAVRPTFGEEHVPGLGRAGAHGAEVQVRRLQRVLAGGQVLNVGRERVLEVRGVRVVGMDAQRGGLGPQAPRSEAHPERERDPTGLGHQPLCGFTRAWRQLDGERVGLGVHPGDEGPLRPGSRLALRHPAAPGGG